MYFYACSKHSESCSGMVSSVHRSSETNLASQAPLGRIDKDGHDPECLNDLLKCPIKKKKTSDIKLNTWCQF